MCKGGNQSTTTTSAPNPQAYAAYADLLSQAEGTAGTPYQPYYGELVAPVNAQQQSGIANINSAANYASPFIQTAAQYGIAGATPITAQQIAQYQDPYTTAVMNATGAQFANQNAQQQASVLGNAIAQGALGGNRTAIAQSELANQQALAQDPVFSNIASQGYTTGLNTALTEQGAEAAGAYSLGNLGVSGENALLTGANAQIGAGGLEQQTQQALDAAAYQQFLNQQAYPFQTEQWLAGLATGVGSQMGGTGTTTGPAPSELSQLVGAGSLGVGILGGTGAFGAAGWLAPAMAARARGGRANGVANYHPATFPEHPETLHAQQRQLVAGHRRAQLFPPGTRELRLPHGMSRVETAEGIFHYDRDRISAEQIKHLAAHGRENEILDLGPYSKHEIMARMAGGEIPLAVVERDHTGTEVRAAVGTHATAGHQLAHMRRTASPGHSVHVEDPRHTIAHRMGRAVGGLVPHFDLGGAAVNVPTFGGGYGTPTMPYAGGRSFVPVMGITHGRGAPSPPPMMGQGNTSPSMQQAGQIGQLAKAIQSGVANPTGPSPTSSLAWSPAMTPATEPAGVSGNAIYWRGGPVHRAAGGIANRPIMLPRGYADGGGPDIPDTSDEGDIPLGAYDTGHDAGTGEPLNIAPATPASVGVAPPPASAPLTRGLRNNNPGNIEDGPFAQSQPGYVGSDGRFARFESPEAGANAQSGLLSSYGNHGVDTLSGVINRWAPTSDGNNTGAYLSYVSQQTGIQPNEKIDLSDPNVRARISGAMGRFESGTLPAGATPTMGVAPPSYGTAPTGVAPPSNGIDWSGSGKLWPALMAAGAGMMASKSPYPGVAMGEGALTGLQTYSTERAQEQAKDLKEEEINLEAKKLGQQLNMEQSKLNEETRYHSGLMERENFKPLYAQTQNGHPLIFDGRTGLTIDAVTRKPVDPNETVTPFSRSGAGGGGVSAWKYNAWLSVHPDDKQGALDYAGGHRQMSPADVEKTALTMAQRDINGDPTWFGQPQEKRQAAIEAAATRYAGLLRSGGAPVVPPTPGAPSGVPTPAAATPAAPTVPKNPAAPPAAALPTGVPPGSTLQRNKQDPSQFRYKAPDGTIYSADGTRMGAPTAAPVAP